MSKSLSNSVFYRFRYRFFLGSCRHDCAEKAFCKPAGTALSATPIAIGVLLGNGRSQQDFRYYR
jgi:hypothetical protein